MTTLQDVARRAGVSMSTASYALSGTRAVTEKTRRKVQDAMNELGYVPNESARSLASRRTRNIALIMPAGFNPLDGTLAAILDSAAKAAIARNYRLSLWPAVEDAETMGRPRSAVQSSISGSAEGVILMEVLFDDPRIAWLQESQIPTVLIGRTEIEHDFDCVDIDFEQAVRDGVATLRSYGHQNIGLINHSRMSFEVGYGPTRRSFEAFRDAVGGSEESTNVPHEFCEETVAAGAVACERLLAAHPDVTAILVMNERASFGVQRHILSRFSGTQGTSEAAGTQGTQRAPRNQGAPGTQGAAGTHMTGEAPGERHRERHAPSIVTVASSPGVSELAYPSFASFDVPALELGATAIDRLIDQLEGTAKARPGAVELVECEFVSGDSLQALA